MGRELHIKFDILNSKHIWLFRSGWHYIWWRGPDMLLLSVQVNTMRTWIIQHMPTYFVSSLVMVRSTLESLLYYGK